MYLLFILRSCRYLQLGQGEVASMIGWLLNDESEGTGNEVVST